MVVICRWKVGVLWEKVYIMGRNLPKSSTEKFNTKSITIQINHLLHLPLFYQATNFSYLLQYQKSFEYKSFWFLTIVSFEYITLCYCSIDQVRYFCTHLRYAVIYFLIKSGWFTALYLAILFSYNCYWIIYSEISGFISKHNYISS